MVYLSEDDISGQSLRTETSAPEADDVQSEMLSPKTGAGRGNLRENALAAASWLWLCGAAVMAGYSV